MQTKAGSQKATQSFLGHQPQPEAVLNPRAKGGAQGDPHAGFPFPISELSLWMRAVSMSQRVCPAPLESQAGEIELNL